jgi:hypothetical protein
VCKVWFSGLRNADLKKEQRNTHNVKKTQNGKKKVKYVTKVKKFGSAHILRSPEDQGGDVCKFWFRSVQRCGFV